MNAFSVVLYSHWHVLADDLCSYLDGGLGFCAYVCTHASKQDSHVTSTDLRWIMNCRNRCKCLGLNPFGWASSSTRKNKSEDDGMTRNVLKTKSSSWSWNDTLRRSRGFHLCACFIAPLSSSEQRAKHLVCFEVVHLLSRFLYSLKHCIGTVYYLWLNTL